MMELAAGGITILVAAAVLTYAKAMKKWCRRHVFRYWKINERE